VNAMAKGRGEASALPALLPAEFDAIRADLGQIRVLLADAISKLTDSGCCIAVLVRAHAQGAPGDLAGPPKVTHLLDHEIARMVSSLQFQDLVDQLIGQTLSHVESIARQVACHDVPVEPDGVRVRRVQQKSLQPGDIELF